MNHRFKSACRRYLTDDMNRLLTYEQKVEMVNFIAKQQRDDNRYNGLTCKKLVENEGIADYSGIGETLDSLPLSDRQRNIARYKYQRYTIPEISQLLYISEATVSREIANIKHIIDDNREMLEPEYDVWSKKTTSYNE